MLAGYDGHGFLEVIYALFVFRSGRKKKLENTDTGESRPPDFRVLLIVVKVKLEKTSGSGCEANERARLYCSGETSDEKVNKQLTGSRYGTRNDQSLYTRRLP